jgi:hypothetical protein
MILAGENPNVSLCNFVHHEYLIDLGLKTGLRGDRETTKRD